MQHKIKTYFIFLSILLGLNVVYFYVYFSFLELSFSWLHLLFILLGNISYSIMINIFRLRIWRLVSYLLMSMFYMWALMNFAYFKVFKTFLDFGLGQFGQINFNFLNFLKDFYYLIPTRLYVVSFIVLVGIIANSILYFKFIDKENERILYKSEKLNFLYFKKPRPNRFYKIIILIVLFSLVNIGAFSACGYLASSPRVSWWKIEQQISDLGVWGHFYTQVYAKVGDGGENIEVSEGELIASEPEEPIKTDMAQTKEVYAEMNKLADSKNTKYLVPNKSDRPNVIIVQLESLPTWILENDPTPMPYLKQLVDSNITVNEFQPNSCQTINAEFSSLCSFWPNSDEPVSYSHQENEYHCLPSILSEEYGYQTYMFHSDYPEFWNRNVLAPKWGFENLYFVPRYNVKQDDISVFSDAIDVLGNEEDPFFAYLISFSTHAPHNDSMYELNYWVNGLDLKPFEEKLNPEFSSIELTEKEVRDYLGFTTATDDALKLMMDKLKEKQMMNDTIIIIYNDHKYYNFKGEDLAAWEMTNNSPFTMILPNKARAEIQDVASHVDIAPTILNLIEGPDYEPRENFVGQSLFAKDFANQVMNKCLGEIYYINKDILVRGNAKTGLYQVFEKFKKMPELKEQRWLDLVAELVRQSDATIYGDGLGR